jgi:hypothetical protein
MSSIQQFERTKGLWRSVKSRAKQCSIFSLRTIDDEGGSMGFSPFDHEKVDSVLVETFLFHARC